MDRTVAITPTKSKNYPSEEVKRVCHDCSIKGFTAMTESRSDDDPPFRFMYMSGIAAERDETKKPSYMPEYSWMRVSVLLEYPDGSDLHFVHLFGSITVSTQLTWHPILTLEADLSSRARRRRLYSN